MHIHIWRCSPFPLPTYLCSQSDDHVDTAPLARAALLAELERGGGAVGAARGSACENSQSYYVASREASGRASG